jgi:hypothetical protein
VPEKQGAPPSTRAFGVAQVGGNHVGSNPGAASVNAPAAPKKRSQPARAARAKRAIAQS